MRSHRLTRRHFRSRTRSGSRGIQRVRTQATEGALAFDGVWNKIAPIIRQACTAKDACRESGFRHLQKPLSGLSSLVAPGAHRPFALPWRRKVISTTAHRARRRRRCTAHRRPLVGGVPLIEAVLDGLVWIGLSSTSPWWPTHGPVTEELCSLQTLAVNRAEGCWDVLSKAWVSLLAVPGILLKRKGHSWLGLMLSSSHFGISRIRRPLNKIGTTWMLDSSLGAGSTVFDIITEHKDWNGMQIDTYTPTDPSSRAGTVRLCPRGDHRTNIGVQRQTGPHNAFCCPFSQVV